MLTSLANTGAANSASATTTKSSQTDASASQDRFLKLLVAQLNNQDPMNPMDNAQMTSQMAQINTVSGIQQLNETIKSMSTQFTSMQVMQGASMIGREVMTEGNTLTIGGGTAKGAVQLTDAADRVTVQVISPGGQVLDTLNLGAQAAGRTNFSWDASKYTGTGSPTFKVTATQGTTAVTATALARNTVESVSSDAAGMTVTLKGGSTVKYDAIKAIL
jgi:flagellar basal-body rod modification protein FlgD